MIILFGCIAGLSSDKHIIGKTIVFVKLKIIAKTRAFIDIYNS